MAGSSAALSGSSKSASKFFAPSDFVGVSLWGATSHVSPSAAASAAAKRAATSGLRPGEGPPSSIFSLEELIGFLFASPGAGS